MNELTDKCLFCKKPKTWNSAITLHTKDQDCKVTVCPECRSKKTLLDMNRRISKLFFKQQQQPDISKDVKVN